MLNFNKKKYVSFDNLSKFSGMIQKALSDKLKNVETNLNEKIDSRFESLTAKEQGDSEVIDAREGQVSLSENLKTYVKSDDFVVSIGEVKSDIRFIKSEVTENTTWRYQNMNLIQKAIEFVNSFKCEFKIMSETNGYLKLPSVLGGFLIQWGYSTISYNNETTFVNLNTPYTHFNYNVQITPYVNTGHHVVSKTFGIKNNGVNVAIKGTDDSKPGLGFYWFTIGQP